MNSAPSAASNIDKPDRHELAMRAFNMPSTLGHRIQSASGVGLPSGSALTNADELGRVPPVSSRCRGRCAELTLEQLWWGRRTTLPTESIFLRDLEHDGSVHEEDRDAFGPGWDQLEVRSRRWGGAERRLSAGASVVAP
jgi:hypothetical protein